MLNTFNIQPLTAIKLGYSQQSSGQTGQPSYPCYYHIVSTWKTETFRHLIFGNEHEPEVFMNAALDAMRAQAQVHIPHPAHGHIVLQEKEKTFLVS